MIRLPHSLLSIAAGPYAGYSRHWLQRIVPTNDDVVSSFASFRAFFAVKLMCTFCGLYPPVAARDLWLHGIGLASSAGLASTSAWRLGACGWAVLSLRHVIVTWPYTLNHFILETLVLAVLCSRCTNTVKSAVHTRELVSVLYALMLATWVYAGIQKIGHGRFLNGETFAIALLAPGGELSEHLRLGLVAVHSILRTEPSTAMPVEVWAAIRLNALERVYCVGISWSVVLAEILLPLLAFWRPREWISVALLVGQGVIGTVSGELDFALSALGLMGLGTTRLHRGLYFALTVAAIGLAVGKPLAW